MSADDPDRDRRGHRPGRAAAPAVERRRIERRAGPGERAPGGAERRAAQRRRGPVAARPPGLEIVSTRGAARAGSSGDARREALRSMLEMADERQARAAARRRDRPVMAPGVEVRVLVGPFAGEAADIVDADYISSRVLVRLTELGESLWLGFAEVGVPG